MCLSARDCVVVVDRLVLPFKYSRTFVTKILALYLSYLLIPISSILFYNPWYEQHLHMHNFSNGTVTDILNALCGSTRGRPDQASPRTQPHNTLSERTEMNFLLRQPRHRSNSPEWINGTYHHKTLDIPATTPNGQIPPPRPTHARSLYLPCYHLYLHFKYSSYRRLR